VRVNYRKEPKGAATPKAAKINTGDRFKAAGAAVVARMASDDEDDRKTIGRKLVGEKTRTKVDNLAQEALKKADSGGVKSNAK